MATSDKKTTTKFTQSKPLTIRVMTKHAEHDYTQSIMSSYKSVVKQQCQMTAMATLPWTECASMGIEKIRLTFCKKSNQKSHKHYLNTNN